MNEQPLPGGGVGGAVLIDGTVRRPQGPWSPAVHALLAHLSGRLDAVPAVHGTDEVGREVLDYLPGEVIDISASVLSPARLVSLVEWTRRFHSACVGFEHPGPWRFPAPDDATLIGHNDLAPWNVCFVDDRVAGVFDWDLAGPSTPLRELAYLAWSSVPLFTDHPAEFCAQRIALIAQVYGDVGPEQLFDAVFDRVETSITHVVRAAAAGDPGMQHLMTVTDDQRLTRRSLAALRTRRAAIASALRAART